MTANGEHRFGDEYSTEYIASLQEDAENEELEYSDYQVDSADETDSPCPEHDRFIRNTSLLEHPETTLSNASDGTYRGRFMAGKEIEYEATLAAYALAYGEKPHNHIRALKDCRTHATLQRDFSTGDVMVFGDSCRDRYCPMCCSQRRSFAKDQIELYIGSLVAPRFLTLTLRNNESDLKSRVSFLQERFSKLRQRAYWKKNVTGGIWFLEVKRGKESGLWHPHLHILLDGNFMEQKRLSELWEQVTFGSPIIHISKVSDVEHAATYISKYVTKPAMLKNMPVVDGAEMINALFRKRLCGTFGTAKAVTLTPPKIETDAEWDYVGHFDDIVERAVYCPLSKLILIAYNTGQPLTEDVYREFTGHDPGPIVHEIREPKVDRQLWLDFYKSP